MGQCPLMVRCGGKNFMVSIGMFSVFSLVFLGGLEERFRKASF